MRTRVAQLSLALIALLIGFALVAQFRSQARPTELTSLPVAELSARIQTLSNGNGQLRAALLEQSDLLAEYRAAGALGTSALDVSREELRRIRAYSGVSGTAMTEIQPPTRNGPRLRYVNPPRSTSSSGCCELACNENPIRTIATQRISRFI